MENKIEDNIENSVNNQTKPNRRLTRRVSVGETIEVRNGDEVTLRRNFKNIRQFNNNQKPYRPRLGRGKGLQVMFFGGVGKVGDNITALRFGDDILVKYPQKVKSVTPGQACVFYLGEQCLGGGIIKEVRKNNEKLWYL